MTTVPKPTPTPPPRPAAAVTLPPAADPAAPVLRRDDPAATPPRRGFPVISFLVLLLVAGAIAYAIYAGIAGRTRAEAKLTQATTAAATSTVVVIHPKPNSTVSDIALPGNTQAFIDAPIYARASGYLKAWYVDIGARVKQGQLLAEIETPELDQQLQQAQADLKNAQANLDISQTTNKRYQDLLASHSVSQQEAAQTASDLASKQALVDAAAANMRRLEQTQGFQNVTAPFDGVITARSTDIGDLIQSGDNSTPHELFHLGAVNKLRVYIAVPEVYAPAVHDGEKVFLTVDSFPGETFSGTVVRNSDAIDLTTRTLNVEVDVDNRDGRLMPGAYAFVHLPVHAQAGTVTIPSDTLLFRSEGLRVGVVRDGKVVLQAITIGHDYGVTVEVTSGLTTGDAIILDPSDSLAEGQAVQVTTAPPAISPK
jgi:RND family efflux transporter MFP subunit